MKIKIDSYYVCAEFIIADNSINVPIFAAHYDTDASMGELFTGAIDAAASCGVVLETARRLCSRQRRMKKTFYVVFFDGEEALPGAPWSIKNGNAVRGSSAFVKYELPRLKKSATTLVLLDLLGARDQRMVACTTDTNPNLFRKLMDTEEAWRGGPASFLDNKNIDAPNIIVEDDQVPFLSADTKIDILHLIPRRFPACWHTDSDNMDSSSSSTNLYIDWAALRDWVCILTQCKDL